MSLYSAVGRLVKNWKNRSPVRRNRRPAGTKDSALESLEQRTLLSAVAIQADDHQHQHESLAEFVACPPAESTLDAAGTSGDSSNPPLFPLGRTFLLNSNPRAPHTIYLDFNGHVTRNTPWRNGGTINSPGYNTEGSWRTFTANELATIQRIWQRVAADFMPFDVNVTTRQPHINDLRNTGPRDHRWGIRVVVTSDSSWYGAAGGVAWMHSFADNIDNPAFVFVMGESAAEAISHEVGHTLGLNHDGRHPGETYYTGHGTGETSWAPIMGSGYSTEVTQWSRGQYPGATQTQNDLNIITNPRVSGWQGLRFKPDDHADTPPRARTLRDNGRGAFVGAGLIERSGDRDTLRFTTAAGEVTIHAVPRVAHTNLDIKLQLLDAAGRVIRTASPRASLDAAIKMVLPAGTYFLRIDGGGKPRVGADYGYTDYGSLGQYVLRVTQPVENADNPEPLRIRSIRFGYGNHRWIGGGQLAGRPAPWAIRQIQIRFHQNALVDIADLTATTDFGSNLRFASFHYDPVRFIATWTLADPIERDRIRFTLDGDGPADDGSAGVRSAAGRQYLQAGDFHAVLKVLQGDVTSDGVVDAEDAIAIRDRRQTSNIWADVNGDGIVDIADALITGSRKGWSL